MAKYDHGGGCACGLSKFCDCDQQTDEDRKNIAKRNAVMGNPYDWSEVELEHITALPELDQIAIMRKALERDWSAYSEHELRELVDDASRALSRCMEGGK